MVECSLKHRKLVYRSTHTQTEIQLPDVAVQVWLSFTITNGGFRGNIYTSEVHKMYGFPITQILTSKFT